MSKKVALVLSSGGSRGLVHIGAIEALEERGYTISSVAGCSIGSIVGGMYAAGRLQMLKDFFLDMNLWKMFKLTDFSLSINHLVKGNRLMERFGTMIPDVNIETLPIPLALVATDFKTGKEEVFRSGNLNRLIRASFSIPVVLQPIEYAGMLLMDGGLTNPLPLNRVVRQEDDLLVAVNVSAPMEHPRSTTDLDYAGIIDRMIDIQIVQNCELMRKLYPVDFSVEIAKDKWGTYDFNRAEEIIAYGHDAMIAAIDRYEKAQPK